MANKKKRTLLTIPAKSKKYALELKDKVKMTNDGTYKVDEEGQPMQLTAEERAYRRGYLDSRRESADMYKYKKAIESGATKKEAKALSFGLTNAKRKAAREARKKNDQ